MDRKELRFRILFEYYSDLHSGDRGAGDKVGAIDVDGNEKRAAEIWLIDEEYVEGRTQIHVSGRIWPAINRINSRGINFAESVISTWKCAPVAAGGAAGAAEGRPGAVVVLARR